MIRYGLLILLFFGNFCYAQTTDIVFWHSLAGALGQELQTVTNGFNQSQKRFRIVLVYKGEYIDSITSFAGAFRAQKSPDILQVFEVGSAIMQHPEGIIKPLHRLLTEQGVTLPLNKMMPAVRAFYSTQNLIQALPFNLSIPVIYYNADILKTLGIDEKNFPSTWQGLEALLQKIKAAGYACGYTTAYPAWIQIESFTALHGIDRSNKHYQSALIIHLKQLKEWQENHYFKYGGRTNDATILFTSGHCPMFSQSSGSYSSLKSVTPFTIGVASLPLDTRISSKRFNNSVGGAALWAIEGKTPEVYAGIAAFYAYFLQESTQTYWHEHTGYIPVIALDNTDIIHNNQSILSLSTRDLSYSESVTPPSTIPLNQIRTINEEALEIIFSNISTVEQALEEASRRARLAIKRFERNTGQSIAN